MRASDAVMRCRCKIILSLVQRRLLKKLGVRLNRPKPTVNCPWPRSRRTRRLQAIQRPINKPPLRKVALYLDGVDIHLNPKIGPEWTLADMQKYVHTPGCNEKRYLAGAA
jgi:putative transposase